MMREILDNTVKGARDFEELGIPMLAQVAFDKRAARTPIAFRGDAHSARSEAYRQLRTNLQFVDVDNPPRIIADHQRGSRRGQVLDRDQPRRRARRGRLDGSA